VRAEEARANLSLRDVEREQVAARLELTDVGLVEPQTRGDRAWIGCHQAR
jgi:hypothetical protein